jgi:hypothetical protein
MYNSYNLGINGSKLWSHNKAQVLKKTMFYS